VFQIGPYRLANPVVLAPMAGVTDLPFRQLCRRLGAGLVVSEMVTSDTKLWNSRKSRLRLDHSDELEPRSVQIAGSDPAMMANAARKNVELGAQIIDINMGCPAKKVCRKAAGSALMKDEALVAAILEAVVAAVDVPVTLKTRTGWAADQKNALCIAKIAESSGIAALAIHGRTRACAFNGSAEYDTIAEVKSALNIPIIANGDIDCAVKAQQVMHYTGADAIMVGRAAQGRPWICGEIAHFLSHGELLPAPALSQQQQIMLEHIGGLHRFYGELMGVKIARKHLRWYLQQAPASDVADFRQAFNQLQCAELQFTAINHYFEAPLEAVSITQELAAGGDNIAPSTARPNNSNDVGDAHNRGAPATHHQEVIAA
jgi:tRNA-dihydrouridine synthase B